MPKLTSSAVSALRITLLGEKDALYCPGAEVRGVFSFTSNRPLHYRTINVLFIVRATGRNHKDHSVSDRIAHYVTNFVGQADDGGAETDPAGSLGCSVADADGMSASCCGEDHAPPIVVGQVAPSATRQLPAGDHVFPFAFIIPSNAPASAAYRVLESKLDVACTILGTVHAAESWTAVRAAIVVPIASIVPRYQRAAEDISVEHESILPLSGVISSNGAAEVKVTVSHRCLCLQDPQPFILSVSVDNIGGRKPIEKITVRLMQYFDMDLLRRGSFLTRSAVVAQSELHIADGKIAARGRGTAGGHLAVDVEASTITILPTMTTEHLRVRHVLQLDFKGGKDPIEIPITTFHFVDDSDRVGWLHYEKVVPSLRVQQWYEVPAPMPMEGIIALAHPEPGNVEANVHPVIGAVVDLVSRAVGYP